MDDRGRLLVAAMATIAVALAGAGPAHAQRAATIPFIQTVAGPSVAEMYPSGLEWDAQQGRIVVADTGNDQIEFYDPQTGRRTGQFGSYGTGTGQFDTPRDVGIDSWSNIYVADAANNRIQKFDLTGRAIWAAGTSGKCATCLNAPLGLSWDATNNQVLVADTGDSLIKAFDPSTGHLLWVSPPGKLLGFLEPRDVTRGPGGLIWVSAYAENQIKAFSVSSVGDWATAPSVILGDGVKGGKGPNEVIFPYNASFSPDGNTAYVADIGNDRIARWDISNLDTPVWLTPFGSRCKQPCPNPPGDAGKFAFLRRTAVESNGDVMGADFEGNGINIFTPTGTLALQIAGTHAPAPGFAQVYGVATGANGLVYGVDRLNQRVEEFSANGGFLHVGGVRGTGPGTFSWPEAAAVAPNGTVWVADTRNSRLERWPADLSTSSPIPSFGSQGRGLGQFNYIEGLAVDSQGVVWVADSGNNRIQTYNPATGSYAVIGKIGTGNGLFSMPQGIAVSSTNVYVADTGNNRIQELTLTGSFVASYSAGLSQPQGVALAPDGSLWVADTGNNAIAHLSASLSNLGDGFGNLGNGDYQFFSPHSLAVSGQSLFVADTYNNRIQVFDIENANGP
jgi:DNA-binding beta-propeller fold protein YncE